MTLTTALPDPLDRTLAWWNGEPAYLAWWRATSGSSNDRMGDPGLSREDLIRIYAYAVPTLEALERVAEWSPLVELGAGAGYWARLLADLGADVVAYDIGPPGANGWIADVPTWTEVCVGDESVLRPHADRTLFVSWPERPDGFMSRVLDRYPPQRLVLITDGRASWQSTDSLYDRLEAGWEQVDSVAVPRWPGRFDILMFWQRKAGTASPR